MGYKERKRERKQHSKSMHLTTADMKRWAVFAVLSLAFFTFFFGYKASDLWLSFGFSAMLLPATLATAFYVNTVLIPRYYFTGRHGWFVFYLVGTLIFSSWLIVATFTGAFYLIADLRLINLTPMSRDLIFVMMAVYLTVISNAVVSLLRQSSETLIRNQELQNQVLTSDLNQKVQELQYLKSQLQPHFLFNSLNTLYGMALKQSDQTPDAIVKLSSLLDYVLYQTENEQVSLSREVAHIQDYMALEQIRFGEALSVDFKTEGVLESVMLPAMLLIPFVENGFKHGTMREGRYHIKMRIEASAETLFFEISNYAKVQNAEKPGGIGLANTQRRLALLYGVHHQLKIIHDEHRFTVRLHLQWKAVKSIHPDNVH